MENRSTENTQTISSSSPIVDLRIEELIPEYEAGDRERQPTHPGAIVASALDAVKLRPHTVAPLIGTSKVALGRILNEQSPVSTEMALRLGKFLGTTPELLIDLQNDYDRWHIRQMLAGELSKIKPLPWQEPDREEEELSP
jgi:addiction module HigA family antidote